MKRTFKLASLFILMIIGFSNANAQVRVFVNANFGPRYVQPCRPVVVVPAPAPVVYVQPAPVCAPVVCYSNCNVHHQHVYYSHPHGHANNHYNNHYNNGYNNGNSNGYHNGGYQNGNGYHKNGNGGNRR